MGVSVNRTVKYILKGDKGDTGIQGLQGIQGPKGDQGIQGPTGATGATTYFHIKYSDSANGSNMNETGGAYIGTYVDFTQEDSTDPSKYTWVLVKGAQGPTGDQGIQGQNGADGQTSYLHIAYATSADGSQGFDVSVSTGKTYIGQYVDFTQEDSTDPTKYTWTLIKGDKGDSGDSVKLLYRYEIDKPTKPTGSNPNGWSNTPDKEIIAITHGTNFTSKDGYYVSPAINHSSIIKNRIYFSTTKVNQSIAIELSVSSEPTYDCALIGILDDNNLAINSNYTKKISGITTIIAIVDIPNIGSHFIDVGYAKDSSVSNNDDNCKYRIVDINKCWISTGYTISGLTTWSDPVIFINDNKSEEYIYAIEDSEITLASPKSDKYIDDFIPKRTYTDYSQSLTWAIGSEVIYNSNYYRCIIANSSANVHLPTETLYWKQIEPWMDNPQGVSLTNKYEYISKRTKANGVWGDFSIPTIWARYSVDGNDGDKGDKGDNGEKGEKGASLRGPQAWSDCAIGYSFQAGGQGDTWKDVVIYGDNYYSCVKNHTKTATNYPTSTEDNNKGYWRLGDKIELVATKILLATYALVKNLGVEAIDMKDSNGNVLFQAKNGNVTCKTGTFDDVTIQSGQIAGFKVSGNGLTNSPFTNDAYVIFRNDTHKCFAGMGGNVLPASSGIRGVARFENEDDTDQWGLGSNIAAILSAKNAAYNFAFIGQGNGFVNGAIEGYMLNQFTPSSTNSGIDVSKGKYVLILGTYGTCYLPTLSAIRSTLGIGTSTNFALRLTVVAGSGASFTLFGYRNGSYGDSTCPHLRNENFGDVTGGVLFQEGDSIDLLLYYNGSYQAQIMNRWD